MAYNPEEIKRWKVDTFTWCFWIFMRRDHVVCNFAPAYSVCCWVLCGGRQWKKNRNKSTNMVPYVIASNEIYTKHSHTTIAGVDAFTVTKSTDALNWCKSICVVACTRTNPNEFERTKPPGYTKRHKPTKEFDTVDIKKHVVLAKVTCTC